MQTKPTTRLIGRIELRRKVPLSDTRVWELERAGKFPKRIQLTANRVAWDEAEVDAWIEARRAEGVAKAAPPPDITRRRWRPCKEAVA